MKWKYITTALFLLILVSGCQSTSAPTTTPTQRSTPGSLAPAQVEHRVQPPEPPSNLITEPISQREVSLQWIDNSDNEDGFKIYRDGSVVVTIDANITVYQDTGLEAGKSYHYIVKAYNVAGESGTVSSTVKTHNPPLNVTINYIGVKDDHDPWGKIQGPGDIRLLLVISDGNQTVEAVMPPGEGTYPLNDYETVELAQRVFHTASAGNYLKLGIIAYDDDPEERVSQVLQVASILAPILGVPYVGDIGAIFSQYEEQTGKPLFENADDYVGYFEGFWGADESWGIGQHNAVGTEDFRVWFSIWSENAPQNIPIPTLLPDVSIVSVDVPSEVVVGKTTTYDIILRNNESHSLTVTLKIHSSATGDVGSQSVTVPANDTITIENTTRFEPAGVRTITYTVLYKGEEIHSLSKTVEARAPDITIESVDVPAEVIVGKSYTYDITLRNNSLNSATVTLKIHSSVTGDVGSQSVTVPANDTVTIENTTRFEPAGIRTITYTVLYKGEEIHSLSKTVEAKAPAALSIDFDGWYVGGSKVDTTTKDKTVTAKISLSGGESGQYTLRIKRDIIWASDEVISELSFSYDGVSADKELSFTPPYATGESSTDGYFVVLVKDGYEIWGLPNTYPPRLRVTVP